VLPIIDSLYDGQGSITGTLGDASRVHQYGGGTGFSFGAIRPRGAIVKSTGREAPGPVEFLQGYSAWFKRVSQAGLRPAANMAILPVEHPDIKEFMACKTVEGDISNFNISVALSDSFMREVTSSSQTPNTAELWTELVDGAWRNGEPGCYFVDSVNKKRLHPEPIHATNPCGEVPLLPYEACVLGSINLAEHMTGGHIDWHALEATTRTLTVMLDNIVDKQDYPLDVIRDTHRKYRKIGVGVMGYADMLIKMGIRYGSSDALQVARKVMSFIQSVSYGQSMVLGEQKGLYPGHEDVTRWSGKEIHRRNLCVQVLAPTGTISWLAGSDHNRVSPGIEPNYGKSGKNFILGGVYDYTHELADSEWFVSYDEVTPMEHIQTQAAFQEFVDQAVSKTVNLPTSATHADVAEIYRLAWQTGCKGVTVYREGSREEVVLLPEGTINNDCATGTCAL
jgi:ribonucleoside-diphosphate reductase alpha chain